jgi:hypothetical protein
MKTKKIMAMMMAAVMASAALTTACSEDEDDSVTPAPVDIVCGEYKKDTVKVLAGVEGDSSAIFLTYFADITIGRGNPKDANDKTVSVKGITGAITELGGQTINFDIVANVVVEPADSIDYPYQNPADGTWITYRVDRRMFLLNFVDQTISIPLLGDVTFDGTGHAAAYMGGAAKDMQFKLQGSVASQLSPTGQLPVSITVIYPALSTAEAGQ